MWAYENDVTFMSSGASNPLLGSGGTGIFLGNLIGTILVFY